MSKKEFEIASAMRDSITSMFVSEEEMQKIASSSENKLARKREMPKTGTALKEAYGQVQGRNMIGMRSSAYDRGASAVTQSRPTGRRMIIQEEFKYDHPDDSDQLGY